MLLNALLLLYFKVTVRDLTITMTTCNRLELTRRTLRSLQEFESIKAVRVLVDCYNETFVEELRREFPSVLLENSTSDSENKNVRHMNNLQQLFKNVKTKWWFHCEDDWEFFRGGFIEDSMRVLTNTSDIYMVIGRQANTFKPHVNKTYGWVNDEYSVLRTNSGPHGYFTSYTANPALLDTSKVHFLIGDFASFKAEYDISRHLGRHTNALVGIFKNHYYEHIGGGFSTMH